MNNLLKSLEDKRAEFAKILPWKSPTKPHPTKKYEEVCVYGVTELAKGSTFHIAIRNGAAHKTFTYAGLWRLQA